MFFNVSLGVKRNTFRSTGSDDDPVFQAIRPAILSRDDQSCQNVGCGFKSPKFNEVHHINSDGNSPDNLVTLCSFCHSTCHIGFAAIKSDLELVYLPQLSHGQWSNVLRSIYCLSKPDRISVPLDEAMQLSSKKCSEFANSILTSSLPELADNAKRSLKVNSVLDLANAMREATDKEYLEIVSLLSGFKVWHQEILYNKQIDYWRSRINWISETQALSIFGA